MVIGTVFVTKKELEKDLDRGLEDFKRELYTRLDQMEARLIPEDQVVVTFDKEENR